MGFIERDNYIDNIRGLAIISVIFIHTVFWSGSSYIPNYMRNFSLFFDVPVFFLLTGMSFYITEKIDVIKQIFKLIVFFSIFVFLCQIFFWEFNINDIISSLTLNSAKVPQLPLIDGSYWFVPMYCVSIIVAYGIIETFKNKGILFIIISLGYYFFEYILKVSTHHNLFGIPIDGLLFYTSCILIGYYFSKYRGKKIWLIITLISLFLYLYLVKLDSNAFILQNYKFPVGLPYVIASFISLSVIMYGNFLQEKSFLTYIGKNSIFFYLGQGISGSIIMKISSYFNFDEWQLKMILLFSINVIFCVFFGYLLSKLFNLKLVYKKQYI